MNRISFCLITLNCQKHLAQALKSTQGLADEIIVVDCGSMDRTLEIAHEFGAKVLYREWTNYSEQRNFAISHASFEWIFSLDSDEELSEKLRASLARWKQSEATKKVYKIPRMTFYIGGWIRHSGWYPNLQKRLFRKDSAKFTGIVHESIEFEGRPGRLKGDLLHYTIDSFAEHEAKAEKYSTLAAQKMFDAGKRIWRPAVWFAAPWAFFYTFVIRAGFLDGSRGAQIAQMAARSVRLKFQKLGALVRAEHPRKS
jgi:glycosyltransferase involved in cell wall biosynthesis